MHDGTIDDAIAHPPTPILKALPPALAIMNMEGLEPVVVTENVDAVAIQSSGRFVWITPHQIWIEEAIGISVRQLNSQKNGTVVSQLLTDPNDLGWSFRLAVSN